MVRRTVFLRACEKVEENKKSYEERAEETKKCNVRLAEMQRYVDLSEEKRQLLLDIVLNGRSSDSDESLLNKGVIVYIKLIEVIEKIAEDFKARGVEVYVIQGKTKQKDRGTISAEFKKNPESKVILLSSAGAESLNLQSTNEIILYDLPDGPGKFNQTIGRVARSFSKFEDQGRSFYIHYVIVEDTLDVYKPILLSSKKELEEEILKADTIPLKNQGSFDSMVLKEVRKELLWKSKGKRGKRK